jgi:hypothetical protein
MGIPLHFGRKRVDKRLGFVADFCPICREVSAFRLMQVSNVRHFNYVPLGKGNVVGDYIQCAECRSRFWIDPARYSGTEKSWSQNTGALVIRTFPGLYNIYRDRLALEAKVKSAPNSLTAAERKELLLEPFFALSAMAEERMGESTRFDTRSSIGCLGTVVLAGGLFFYSAARLSGKDQDHALIIMLIIGGAGLAYTLLQFHLGPARYINQTIAALLARALNPLAPRREELEQSLERCRAERLAIAKLKSERLWSILKKKNGHGPRME